MGLILQCCDYFNRDWIKSWEKTWETLETVCLQQIFHLASLGLCRYAQHQKYFYSIVFKSCDTFGCMPCNKSLKLNLVWIFERITLVKWATCSWKQHNQMNYYFSFMRVIFSDQTERFKTNISSQHQFSATSARNFGP